MKCPRLSMADLMEEVRVQAEFFRDETPECDGEEDE